MRANQSQVAESRKSIIKLVVHTSSPTWLPELAKAYRARTAVELIDDAGLGIDPVSQTLLEMGHKVKLNTHAWIAVLVALGMAGVGAWLIVMAVLDPEPWSKVGFALGGGMVMTLGGGFTAIRVLTGLKPPHVTVSPGGLVIRWDQGETGA